MKANRRDFIRKAALGSIAISSGGSLPGLSTMNNPGSADTNEKKVSVSSGVHPASPGWEITFNEATSNLSLVNGPITVHGQLSFISGTSKWTVARSRDGVQDRYA